MWKEFMPLLAYPRQEQARDIVRKANALCWRRLALPLDVAHQHDTMLAPVGSCTA